MWRGNKPPKRGPSGGGSGRNSTVVAALVELWSEDFQSGRLYGGVRAVNPFLQVDEAADGEDAPSS
jgi:hypothetical protein